MTSAPRGPTALVLAGGGSHGAVQVGMLRALARAGFRPDLIVGTSVGAINGAYFASNPTLDGVERLATIWEGVRRSDVYRTGISMWLPALLGRRSHLCDPSGLTALMVRSFGELTFESLPVRCAVVAADFHDGREVILERGRVRDAVCASAAVPVIFPPVERDGQLLVDGAVCRNTAVSVAVGLGARHVVVLPTGFACAAGTPPRGAIATALHHVSVQFARQLAAEVAELGRKGAAALHVVPPLCPLPMSSYDFSGVRALMASAERSTRAWLDAGGLDATVVPAALAPHVH